MGVHIKFGKVINAGLRPFCRAEAQHQGLGYIPATAQLRMESVKHK
jgi:hypothetical protein